MGARAREQFQAIRTLNYSSYMYNRASRGLFRLIASGACCVRVHVGATAESLAAVIKDQLTNNLGLWRPSLPCSCAINYRDMSSFLKGCVFVTAAVLSTHTSDAMSVASVNVRSASPRSLRPPALIRLRTGATRPDGWLAGSFPVC